MVSVVENEEQQAGPEEHKGARMGRELKGNEDGENCWTEILPEDVPEGSEGAAKVAQAAVLVQACHHAVSAEDAADALTSCCELGREIPGGPNALLETGVLDAAVDALDRLADPSSGSPDLSFLVADLARIVSRESPAAVSLRILRALVSALERELNPEMYMAVAMVCHHLLHGDCEAVLGETGAVTVLVAGLESDDMRGNVSVVQHGLAVLAATVLRADSAPAPQQLIAVEICVRQHQGEAAVQRQGLRYMAVAAMRGLSLPNSAELALASLEEHCEEANVCAPALSLLAALPTTQGAIGLGSVARAIQVCMAADAASPAMHGMMLLVRMLESNEQWQLADLLRCVDTVSAAAEAWHGKDQPMSVALMAGSRLARFESVRHQLIDSLLPKMTSAVQSCSTPQPWAPGLQALMELTQDGCSVRAANAGGIEFVVAALERHGAQHAGLVEDGLLALWMLKSPEAVGRNAPLWLRATEVATKLVAAHSDELQLQEALKRLDE